MLTPTKETALVEANVSNRRGTVRQIHSKVKESGLGVSQSSVFRWFKSMGAVSKRRWIKPAVTFEQRWNRLNFVVNQVDDRCMRYPSAFNTIHVDETWFYLMSDGEHARYFPGEVVDSAPTVQHKSHIPKVMAIVANARPDPNHEFDGKIGIWRICSEKVAEKSSRHHQKGDRYQVDVTIDSAWYRGWYLDCLLPAIKQKMPWMRNREIVVQQDGARPHTGKGNLDALQEAGNDGRWSINLITQPAQSPDLNINDLGFFRSLKTRVLQMRFSTIEGMMKVVYDEYERYDTETLERVWQCLFVVYNKVLEELGGNGYKLDHTGTRQAQLRGELNSRVEVNRAAYDTALEFLLYGR
jgi:hypothetical protein